MRQQLAQHNPHSQDTKRRVHQVVETLPPLSEVTQLNEKKMRILRKRAKGSDMRGAAEDGT